MDQKLFSKNFTLLILGQASSLFGNNILTFALSMYVLEITGSATIFAGILALSTIPTIILSPLGGVLADRANRKITMVILDTLTGISILFVTMIFSVSKAIPIITILLVALSILEAFESPTVQACVPQMQVGDNITKGNAIVTQITAIAGLLSPIIGSLFYINFGLMPVMYGSIVCFFVTALFESFIKLKYVPSDEMRNIFSIIKNDFSNSLIFIYKTEESIFKLLLLSALIGFFVIGTALIGLPYIVRSVLNLGAEYYGIAESILGMSAIIGSIVAGVCIGKVKINSMYITICTLGIAILFGGIGFLFPLSAFVKYIVILIAFCLAQISACVFSIFAMSYIQQITPNNMIGKVMSYITTITLCAQPLGQILYGLLFDRFTDSVYFVLIPTGTIVIIIGLFTSVFFKKLEIKNISNAEREV